MTTPCLEVAVWRKKKENECIIRVFKNKAGKTNGESNTLSQKYSKSLGRVAGFGDEVVFEHSIKG